MMDRFQLKFKEEATEHIKVMEESLLALEQAPDNLSLIEKTFRAMHTLKGGGAMFGFSRISELMHNLESIFDLIRNQKKNLSQDIIEVALLSVDWLKILIDTEPGAPLNNEHGFFSLLERIKILHNGQYPGLDSGKDTPVILKSSHPLNSYYIRFFPHENLLTNGSNPLFILDELVTSCEKIVIPHCARLPLLHEIEPEKCYIGWEIVLVTEKSTEALKEVFMFVEDSCELEIILLATGENILQNESVRTCLNRSLTEQLPVDLTTIKNILSADRNDVQPTEPLKRNGENKISSIRVEASRIDQLMNYVSELVTTQASLNMLTEDIVDPKLTQVAENIQKLTRELRDLAFSIALIPIDHALIRFQRLVRDLSKDLGKEVDFITEGTDTELDKNIIEALTDPILHILRNCLDHGIETTEKRIKTGKPARGRILFKAFYTGSNVVLQISDDGAGIDPEKLQRKALEKGLITPDQSLSRKELFELIFLPGFSTSEKVTSISGRGVGMDVVNRKIAEIRGTVEIDSELNVGTTITIRLPLTLSIIDGILVQIDTVKYLIPLSAIGKIYPVRRSEYADKFNKLIVLEQEQIPFFRLRDEFEITENFTEDEHAIVVFFEEKKVALIVDHVIGEYQAVLKPLGKHYRKQDFISGGTILGDGSVALVLDTNKIILNCAQKNIMIHQ